MIILTAVDNRLGTLFNHRRQSRDEALRRSVLDEAGGAPLWMNSYSLRQFKAEAETEPNIRTSENFLFEAGLGEFCFVESTAVAPVLDKAERIILYRWNRDYPADTFLDIDLSDGWILATSENFSGKSHEEITKEVYIREEK